MDILPARMSVYHLPAWFLQRSEEGIVFSETGVTDSCEPCESWESSQGHLQKQVLLTAEPSVQPLILVLV